MDFVEELREWQRQLRSVFNRIDQLLFAGHIHAHLEPASQMSNTSAMIHVLGYIHGIPDIDNEEHAERYMEVVDRFVLRGILRLGEIVNDPNDPTPSWSRRMAAHVKKQARENEARECKAKQDAKKEKDRRSEIMPEYAIKKCITHRELTSEH
ncbi:hypothetical protein QR680_019205 [Steinernema hermaphroditum]|uniref:Uncharacterized protein n=1 Tax=Steinernema hermaphroditum TaxID=289476 RepID=A0AA39HLA8_9BILA|nr:hypothetical protein QR680_019205 [Steinernema hermaphroditum]